MIAVPVDANASDSMKTGWWNYRASGRRGMVAFVASMLPITASALPPPEADPALAPWFKGLTSPETLSSCCDVSDCRSARSRYAGGHYEVWIDRGWIEVPDEKVIHNSPNPTGAAVLCHAPKLGIICFVPEPAS